MDAAADSMVPGTLAWAPRTRLDGLVLGACARFDRFVMEHFIRRQPAVPVPGLCERLERAERFYGDARFIEQPDAFFTPPGPLRTELASMLPLPGGDLCSLRYESDFEPRFPEARGDPLDASNRKGVAIWWRHAEPGRPAMLCVHGYGGGQPWLEALAFEALRSYRAGIDIVLYILPYHGPRTPPGSRHSGERFFDMDLVRTNEAFARAIHELRALIDYLRAAGTGPIGAFGMSLGAYTAALLATVEPALAFVAAMIPVVSFADRWWAEGATDRWLAVAMECGWSRERVRLLTRLQSHSPVARSSRSGGASSAREATRSAPRRMPMRSGNTGIAPASTGTRADIWCSSAGGRLSAPCVSWSRTPAPSSTRGAGRSGRQLRSPSRAPPGARRTVTPPTRPPAAGTSECRSAPRPPRWAGSTPRRARHAGCSRSGSRRDGRDHRGPRTALHPEPHVHRIAVFVP